MQAHSTVGGDKRDSESLRRRASKSRGRGSSQETKTRLSQKKVIKGRWNRNWEHMKREERRERHACKATKKKSMKTREKLEITR